MNNLESIEQRKSRRSYLETPIGQEKLKVLTDLIDNYNQENNLSIQLIKNGSEAFNGIKKSYGLFKGVRTLLVLIGKKDDIHLKEKLGYYGELLVLEATKMDLGTCWVGATFDRNSTIATIQEDETLVCVITIGNVAKETFKEKLVHKIVTRKTKALDELYIADCTTPEWFINGLQAVQKAPSANNNQPVKFQYKEGDIRAYVEESYRFNLVDLGIAKAHFSIAAGSYFEFGNYGKYKFIEDHGDGFIESNKGEIIL